MDELLHEMGNRIISRRKQLRLTQEELAEAADLTPQTVSTAELGKKSTASRQYHQTLQRSGRQPGLSSARKDI